MTTIALLTESRHDRAARDLRERLVAHWPRGCGEVSVLIRHAGEGLPPAPTLDACLVIHSTDIADAALYHAVRELEAAHVPIVAVGGDGLDPRLTDSGVHVASAAHDPLLLTGILAGMAVRTPRVRQFAENLRFAQSVHESVSRLVEQFQDDQLLAASIQRQFVSQDMPVVPGVSCAAMFRPVDFLSGDIYGVTQLDDDHIGFFLGDAMGHGLPAALMALYIAGRVTQKDGHGAERRLISPAESMTRLNRDLSATGCSNVRFATAVCGILNVKTRDVQLSAAGHPPPLVLGSRPTRKIDAGGPLLGVMDDTLYEQANFRLEPGETLILYSDGLEDSLNPRRSADERDASPRDRHITFLEGVAKEVGGADPERMFARFAHILDTQAGSLHQVDDVTLVGVRLNPGDTPK